MFPAFVDSSRRFPVEQDRRSIWTDEALAHLSESVKQADRFAAWAREDEDFESLREDPRFRALTGERGPEA